VGLVIFKRRRQAKRIEDQTMQETEGDSGQKNEDETASPVQLPPHSDFEGA
jgi:hypothetical protein